MYTDDDLESAVAAGIFTAVDADAFRQHVSALKGAPAVDDEHFRLLTGFNDIFVVIACVLLIIATARLGGAWSAWFGGAMVSVVSWLLAEFFVRKRRMALPAIVLLVTFVGGVFSACLSACHATSLSAVFPIRASASDASVLVPLAASTLSVAAAWLHWRRFQVPITLAIGLAAAIFGTSIGVVAAIPETRTWFTGLSFVGGLVAFSLAMRWDRMDVARQTRHSDIAFWLHLLAAPLLVHPIFSVVGVFTGHTTALQATAVALLYAALAVISLCIDRRALMVSSLSYVVYTLSLLFKQTGLVSLGFAVAALCIGLALVLLSAFWHASRVAIVNTLPMGLRRYFPPI